MNTSESFNGTNANCERAVNTESWKSVAQVAAYGIIMMASLVGNVLVCFIVHQNKKMWSTLNCLLVNMAISDLVIPIVVVPRRILEIASASDDWRIEGGPGIFFCKLVYFVSDICPIVSILSLVYITVDRFIAVVFPFRVHHFRSCLRFLIAFSWVFAIAFCAPYFYAFKVDDQKKCVMHWGPAFDHEETRERHTTALCVIFILIPFTLLLVMYSVIMYKLQTRPKMALNQTERGRRRRERSNRNITILSFMIVIIFGSCWGPYFSCLMTVNFIWRWDASKFPCHWDTLWFIAQFLAYSNAAINPSIYFLFMKDFRNGLETICYTLKRKASFTSSKDRTAVVGASNVDIHNPMDRMRPSETSGTNREFIQMISYV